MIKEGALFDLDSLNQVKEAYNLDEDCIQRNSDKFSKLKHFLDNTKGKTTEIMNSSDTDDTELIFFSGNGPLFSLSKRIINSIPYSYIYEQSEEELRTSDGDVFLDYRGNDASVYYLIDYLNGKVVDYSQIMFREQAKLLELFEFCNLPIPIELLECRGKRDEKQKIYKKCDEVSLNINGKKDDTIKNYFMKNNLWDDYVMRYNNGYVDYDYINDIRSMNMSYKYMKCITEYIESGYFYVKKEEIKNIDIILLENEIASEHNYLASKFHRYCDNKGETVTLIKHIGHNNHMNIFGGYTNQKFLFTLSNEHNIPPTKYDNTNSSYGIGCGSSNGSTFGLGYDIYIYDQCHSNTNSYCREFYYSDMNTSQKSSLFVNANNANSFNNFTLEDYKSM
ncbi:hypothetical protein WA158_000881 [Blastocystis sp. Blastoise]